jgi:hypothetical protein
MEKQIEELAIKLLNNIEKHTSLCENDYERNIFLQGVNEGYNAAHKEVQGYREALSKIIKLCKYDKFLDISYIAESALSNSKND